ncbi:arylesterase [Phyllobacterium endophyticum]|uniref:Arylesterase n=1 Tax=Phyllobacterium endophyticum TaxID=1149773 RepID=A0A2P7AZ32_9HYPH|nr:arylesterase [Phyllobacterium endophyticum]MBB3235953.1 acyl-CoA thioesterase-1 [Phyllobacterium endophyticum]PSH59468.1 arylesterase [Phyllobacterium endophyticum]TYR41604.1 arylesterase [Phyllobacterium endophyticum]
MRFKSLIQFFVLSSLVALPSQALANQNAVSDRPLTVVGFGDSLMSGFQLPVQDSFTAQLEKALRDKGINVTITNAGVAGETTADGVSRLDWSIPEGTDIVILEFGANDALRGIAPEISEKNLSDMIEKLKQRNVRVILAGMLAPPNMGNDFADKFNAIFPRLANKYDVPLYPFFLDGVATVKSLQLEDGEHPNTEGVAKMVEGFLPIMEETISQHTASK